MSWIDDEEARLVTILLLQRKLEKIHHENYFHPMEILILKPLMHILLMHSLLLPYC
jgi:hypothetical protein